jgi:hypothetical protein
VLYRAIMGSGLSNDTRKERNLTSIFQEGSKISWLTWLQSPLQKLFGDGDETNVANEVLPVIFATILKVSLLLVD